MPIRFGLEILLKSECELLGWPGHVQVMTPSSWTRTSPVERVEWGQEPVFHLSFLKCVVFLQHRSWGSQTQELPLHASSTECCIRSFWICGIFWGIFISYLRTSWKWAARLCWALTIGSGFSWPSLPARFVFLVPQKTQTHSLTHSVHPLIHSIVHWVACSTRSVNTLLILLHFLFRQRGTWVLCHVCEGQHGSSNSGCLTW